MGSIRQMGDSTLHNKPFHVDFSNKQHVAAVHDAIKIMQFQLHKQGGVGIAANQCQDIINPPQVIIVGTNDPTLVINRYPDRIIPKEIIMINPAINDLQQPYYPEKGEGCLSIKTGFRARVKRFRIVDVEYYDINGNKQALLFNDFTAHIIQHEVDHLQGIVYLQKVISELDAQQIEIILNMLQDISTVHDKELTAPSLLLAIDRDQNNKPILVTDIFKIALTQADNMCLESIKNAAMLQKQHILNNIKHGDVLS